jgi:hypothetical protein
LLLLIGYLLASSFFWIFFSRQAQPCPYFNGARFQKKITIICGAAEVIAAKIHDWTTAQPVPFTRHVDEWAPPAEQWLPSEFLMVMPYVPAEPMDQFTYRANDNRLLILAT